MIRLTASFVSSDSAVVTPVRVCEFPQTPVQSPDQEKVSDCEQGDSHNLLSAIPQEAPQLGSADSQIVLANSPSVESAPPFSSGDRAARWMDLTVSESDSLRPGGSVETVDSFNVSSFSSRSIVDLTEIDAISPLVVRANRRASAEPSSETSDTDASQPPVVEPSVKAENWSLADSASIDFHGPKHSKFSLETNRYEEPFSNDTLRSSHFAPGPRNESWAKRLSDSNRDRVSLSRVLASLILILGFIHVLPATIEWFANDWATNSAFFPRWIYLQVFVGAIHVLYVILLFQVPDWSTLRGVSLAMLAFAFLFGILSTALLIEGGIGAVTGFLTISQLTIRPATMWCVLMLCLSTAVAMLLGKEANEWRRAEQLMVEILGRGA